MKNEGTPEAGNRMEPGAVNAWRAFTRLRRRALRWWWGAPPATFHDVSAETIVVVVWRDCGVRWMP
jgi:hypothetical protein